MAPPDRCHPHWLCANTSSSRLQRHHQSASNGTIAVKITAMAPSLSSSSAVRQLMFNLPSMAPSIRLQWHHRCHPHWLCANTSSSRLQRHHQSASNGTIAVKLQQWHHRCHPHRLCANSCSICPQWHPQSAFNGTTRPLSSSLAVRQHIFIPPSTAPSIRQQWHH